MSADQRIVSQFVVHGDPAPQGSKRHIGGGRLIEASKKLPAWREAIVLAAVQASPGHVTPGPVTVHAEFRFHRPKSHYGVGRNLGQVKASAPSHPCTRATPDIDKLLRGVLDAITIAGLIGDDSQVVRAIPAKVYVAPGEPTGARVTLMATEAV